MPAAGASLYIESSLEILSQKKELTKIAFQTSLVVLKFYTPIIDNLLQHNTAE